MDDSIRNWIPGLQQKQPRIIEAFVARVQPRLLQLARAILRGVPSGESDEEDVVNAALHSFLWRTAEEQFEFADEDDLWKVVQTIVTRKALNHLRRQGRRRDLASLSVHAELVDESPYCESQPLERLIEAEVIEQLFATLGDRQLQTIARMKLERHTNLEIAAAIDRSVATVERRLKMIRQILLDEWETRT